MDNKNEASPQTIAFLIQYAVEDLRNRPVLRKKLGISLKDLLDAERYKRKLTRHAKPN